MTDEKQMIRFRDPESGDIYKVEFLCPGIAGPDARYFLFGHEFGATHLICGFSFDDAYDEYLDSQPAIADDDVWQAYGFHDQKTYEFVSSLEEDEQKLWLRDYGIHKDGEWGLVEEYAYIPNSGGTNGVVYLGHYFWFREVFIGKRKNKNPKLQSFSTRG